MPAEHRALLTPEALREYHTSEVERVRTEAAQAAEARAAAEAADRSVRERQQGEAQQDIDFYTGLKARLNSPDAEVAAKALEEFKAEGAESRYTRGAGLAARMGAETQQREVLSGLFDAMHSELEGAGLTGILPKPGSAEWKTLAVDLAQYDGKGGFAAYLIDKGKTMGDEAGYARAKDEFERNGRIEGGKGGGPEGGSFTDANTGRFADPQWVESQRASDPGWDGRPTGEKDAYNRDITNLDKVMRAMSGRAA